MTTTAAEAMATNNHDQDDEFSLHIKTKEFLNVLKKARNLNGKSLSRSKSLLENTTTPAHLSSMSNSRTTTGFDIPTSAGTTIKTESVIDDDDDLDIDDNNTPLSSNYQSKFIRGGTHHKIRMSKTIKQMFKNVVKYQMNALNCLEKFYEAQVLKLETDRRRNLALNPENREFIIQFYDSQLAQLEERVYSNLTYICKNRCNGCNSVGGCNGQNNSSLFNNSKMSRMVQLLMQHQYNKSRSQLQRPEEKMQNDEMLQSQFKRQFSLPFQCKNIDFNYQLPPMLNKHLYHGNQVKCNLTTRNVKKFSQKSSTSSTSKTKYAKQFNSMNSASSILNDVSSAANTKKYSKKIQNNDVNFSATSNETLNSISFDASAAATNNCVNKNRDLLLPVRRQIKSASSLLAVDENEVHDEQQAQKQALNNKRHKLLTNGSLTLAIQNSSKNSSSNLLLNSIDQNATNNNNNNNDNDVFSPLSSASSVFFNDNNSKFNQEHKHQSFDFPALRLSDSFQQLKFAEQQILQPYTSSPTHARRHTYGSDKYFNLKSLISNYDIKNLNGVAQSETNEMIDSKRQKQINTLKETQV